MKNNELVLKIILFIILLMLIALPVSISFLFYYNFTNNSKYTETLLAIFGTIYLLIASIRYSSYIKYNYNKEKEELKKGNNSNIEKNKINIRKSQLFLVFSGLFLFTLSLIVYFTNK